MSKTPPTTFISESEVEQRVQTVKYTEDIQTFTAASGKQYKRVNILSQNLTIAGVPDQTRVQGYKLGEGNYR